MILPTFSALRHQSSDAGCYEPAKGCLWRLKKTVVQITGGHLLRDTICGPPCRCTAALLSCSRVRNRLISSQRRELSLCRSRTQYDCDHLRCGCRVKRGMYIAHAHRAPSSEFPRAPVRTGWLIDLSLWESIDTMSAVESRPRVAVNESLPSYHQASGRMKMRGAIDTTEGTEKTPSKRGSCHGSPA